MTIAVVDQIGDAVAAEIAAQQGSTIIVPAGYDCTPACVAALDLNQLENIAQGDLFCQVVPEAADPVLLRRGNFYDYFYDYLVYVYAKVPDFTNDTIRPLKLYVEQISDRMGKRDTPLAAITGQILAYPWQHKIDDMCNPDWLTEKLVFASLMPLRVKFQRQL